MAGDAFGVDVERTEPVVLLSAHGDVDSATVDTLQLALDDAITAHERHVVVDTRPITFIDSTGITALVSGLKRLNRTRRRLALVCEPGGPVGRALRITGLDHTFECHDDPQAAIDALGTAPLIGR